MAIKSPAELQKEAAATIAEKEQHDMQEREQRQLVAAETKEKAEQHLAEIAGRIEGLINDLVKLAMTHRVKAVIIGKYDNNGNAVGRPDWIPNESELVFNKILSKLPEGFTLTTIDASSVTLPEGSEKLIPGYKPSRGGGMTPRSILMPAELLKTNSVAGGKRGSYMLLEWN